MNILILGWRDPGHPSAGGAEQVVHEHAKGLVKAGHKVTLFSSRFNNAKEQDEIDGIKIKRGGNQMLGVHIRAFYWYLFGKHDKYDLVIDQFHGIPFFTPLYVKAKKLAITQETAREVWFLNPLPFPINFIIGVIGFILEPLMYLPYKNTRFITGSESAKIDIAKFGIPTKNIFVVPHGVIVSNPDSQKKEVVSTITYLGVLSKDKGIEDALRCFEILNKTGNFKFWVIGKTETEEYRRKIEYLTKELGIEEKIKFWGYVNLDKKFELLARSNLLINPSVREGWGLVNIEANAMKTPVVAYTASGLVDSVKDGYSGILCKDNTPEELAENILKMLSDENEYLRFQKNAYDWSKQFSWDKSRKISLRIIENL